MPLPKTDKIQEALDAQKKADEVFASLTEAQRQVVAQVLRYMKPNNSAPPEKTDEGLEPK